MLLRMNSPIKQISSERAEFLLAQKGNNLYTDFSLQKHNRHVLFIGSGRMTIPIVRRIFDLDNMDFVELEHYDVGKSTH